MKNREYTIDFLKFFAVLLITNSHLEVFEPAYSLGTGGSIGDVLFIFCSGYTLFLGQMGRFDNWYKKRLSRIFPPVISWGIISAFCFDEHNAIDNVILEGGGWFVQCILLYYLLAYPIKKYLLYYLNRVFVVFAVIVIIWFYLISKDMTFNLYGWNYCKWAVFFLFFLQGTKLSLQSLAVKSKNYSFKSSFIALLACILTWYGILYLQQLLQWPVDIQILSLIPLLGTSYFFFICCKSDIMNKIFHFHYLNKMFRFISGLCFEIYLVQYTLFTHAEINVPYPYNIFIIWLLIFSWAYILHVFNNFIMQTLRDENYEWENIFKVY